MNNRSRFSRRKFLWIALLFLIVSTVTIIVRRFNTARQIVDFFGFDSDVEKIIQQNLHVLQSRQKHGYRETVTYFALDHYRLGFLIPKELSDRVIGYWSKVLLLRRSIAWPYVQYAAYGDHLLCDGLIR